jgi:hypothetical protein
MTDVKACQQYKDLSPAELDAAKNACTSGMGSQGSGCDAANLLGCCTIAAGTITVETCYYPAKDLTVDLLKMNCSQSNGMWTATP